MLSGYEHLFGGLSGGIASTLICHPLDLLRIRYAANEGNTKRPQYRSYWHAFRTIARAEGVRGLYQGLSPSIIASPLSWGLYFHIYHKLHAFTVASSDPNEQSFLKNLVLGCVAGSIVMAMTNPLWVVKTRLCLQYENSVKQYRGLADCLRQIYARESISGLYKGFVPGLIGTANGSVQFAFYNFLKDWRCSSLGEPSDAQLRTLDYLFFSSLSKILATMATYPYQVLRTRLQDHNTSYTGVAHCLRQTWQREGVAGLYKGMLMATAKQMPTGVITYVVYEYARRLATHI